MFPDTATRFGTAVPLAPHVQLFALLHAAMRRDADRLVRALAALEPTEQHRARGIAEWYERFVTALVHHHEGEDHHFWPALRDREPGFAAVEARMHQDHHVLDRALDEVRGALAVLGAAAAEDWEPARRGAESAAVHLRAVLADHLELEERGALGPMGELLTPEEFERIDAAVKKSMPLRVVAFIVPWILEDLAADEVGVLRRPGTRTMLLAWRLVWRRRYERLVAPLGR